MHLTELIHTIESNAPLNFQEKWDNSGLQVGNKNMLVSDVLLCVDVTERVINEAIEKKCQLILSHHPLIFSGLKTLQGNTEVERCVIKAIQHNIAIYSAHTNMDNWLHGVNGRIATKIGLTDIRILHPQTVMSEQGEAVGSGVIGYLSAPENELDFFKRIKATFCVPALKYTKLLNKPIQKVALCGGSGSFLIPEAIQQKADVFLSADFKYHDFFLPEERLIIADIGHYESEHCIKEIFFELISKKIPTFAIHFSETDSSPVNYL